jgi:putative membrane protein
MASTARDGFWLRIIYVVSAVLSLAVAFLFWGPRPAGTEGALDVSALPAVNASLNGLTTLLLITAVLLVQSGRVEAHRKVMLMAFASSAAFLTSYVIYHWFKAGPKPYVGEHRGIYLSILLTHIVLAAAVLPLQLVTLYRGWADHRAKHRRLARITFPIWLYVSVTGVAIYAMLY